MKTILTLAGICKSFGSLMVVDNLSLSLNEGEALGIIGPNGAGKTTLFNLIAGGLSVDIGHISFQNQDITQMAPSLRCRTGIARSYQIPHPFVGMTVFENLLVGAAFGQGQVEKVVYDRCVDILERTGLLPKANVKAGGLTLLERKRLELARALATNPTVFLLDEIAGGLTDHECQALIELIKQVHQSGVSIIWIEHIVHALLAVVDRLIVMNYGQKIAEGDPHTVMNSAEVQTIYMGVEANA